MTGAISGANALLGYPSDARLLILNADDFGLCHAVNAAIFQTLQAGAVTSCTLMAPCPWALHAVRLLQATPNLVFGVHLTVISEQPVYRWGPLTCRGEVPSLVDEHGYFYSNARAEAFLDQVDLKELELEYRAQIEWVLAHGLKPTHLDSHCGSHTRRAHIFELSLGLAREYGLALRVYGAAYIHRLQSRGLPTLDHDLLDSYRLPTADKVATLSRLLRDLPAGLSEWALHPGLGTPEMVALEPNAPVRPSDFAALMAPGFREAIREEGIVLLDYSALQAAWSACEQ